MICVVSPQNMLLNDRIGYSDANYSINYSQFSYGVQYANKTEVLPINSTSYVNASFHNSTSHVTNNYGRINEILARYSVLMLMIRLPMLLITIAEPIKI